MRKIEEAKLLKALTEPQTRCKAFTLLVSEYSKPLYWKIRSLVLSHDDTDDILQDTFLKESQRYLRGYIVLRLMNRLVYCVPEKKPLI